MRDQTNGLSATLELELVGTERLAIVPLGGNTEVQMGSSWPHPSFAGRFLPSEREVKPDGFNARWRLSALATTAQQDIANGKKVCDAASTAGSDHALAATAERDCADSFSVCLLYTSPSPRDKRQSRMPSSA